MKKILYTLTAVLVLFFASCEEGIDPISVVEPGVDAAVPVVTFMNMYVGTNTKNTLGKDVVTLNVQDSVTIQFKVVDDIELGNVKVKLNGTLVEEFSSFLDYRRFIHSVGLGNLGLGEYVLSVEVSDKDGNSNTNVLNFKKSSPYTRYTSNEVIYLPFDSTYQEMIALGQTYPNGGSYFSKVAKIGDFSLFNPTGAYVSVPADKIMNPEVSFAFWWFPTSTPKSASILTCGSSSTDLTHGFRLYRTGSPSKETFTLSIGNGSTEIKNALVSVNPKDSVWRHIGISISATAATIYVDGIAKGTTALTGAIDWTGCENLVIGGDNNTAVYATDESKIDELRAFNKALTDLEMAEVLKYKGGASAATEYTPKYDGEKFFMNFDGGSVVELVAQKEIVTVGAPASTAGKINEALKGGEGASLEVSTEGFTNSEFSAAFWMKLDPAQERAGILTVGNPDDIGAANPRIHGFRLFHEKAGIMQRIKMNVGNGEADAWNDGIDIPMTEDWVHIAITIAADKFTIYVNGVKGSLNNLETGSMALTAPISWAGCPKFEFFTGGATFAYWNHGSDLGSFDEVRLFNKTLTDAEVSKIYDDEK